MKKKALNRFESLLKSKDRDTCTALSSSPIMAKRMTPLMNIRIPFARRRHDVWVIELRLTLWNLERLDWNKFTIQLRIFSKHGPDAISPWVLKGFTGEVFLCLKRLTYTASRSVGKLPAYLNFGRVLFVRNDGAKVDVFNPRFILLMPSSQVMQPLDTGKFLLAENMNLEDAIWARWN